MIYLVIYTQRTQAKEHRNGHIIKHETVSLWLQEQMGVYSKSQIANMVTWGNSKIENTSSIQNVCNYIYYTFFLPKSFLCNTRQSYNKRRGEAWRGAPLSTADHPASCKEYPRGKRIYRVDDNIHMGGKKPRSPLDFMFS